jgi:hypothetical protein
MEQEFIDAIQYQFLAAVETLDTAVAACPEEVWSAGQTPGTAPWYLAFHTAFWLDYYLSEPPEESFTPPPPFGREEFDPEGVMPPRVYSREEIRTYIAYSRQKAQARFQNIPNGELSRRFKSGWMDFTFFELLLYNMRHLQHHAAQINLIVRHAGAEPARWVSGAKSRVRPR